jgi:hypothetical protein
MLNCRGCNSLLNLTFLNLGSSPIANDLLSEEGLNSPEVHYPLHVMTCEICSLVQLPSVVSPESLFRPDYVYFSSYSSSWLNHSQDYATKIIKKMNLSSEDLVIEVASNDGYLLQYFVEAGIQVLGIEPSSGVAEVAIQKNIPTLVDFFGSEVAQSLSLKKKPRLMLGNNVLAHVPNLHDFIQGFSALIADDGLITFEFPHLLTLIQNNLFDTIYHEHFSYLSITSLNPVFQQYGLRIVDVENLPTHGGSIRVYLCKNNSSWETSDTVAKVFLEESAVDPRNPHILQPLQDATMQVKVALLEELLKLKRNGAIVAGYGAAAKGNTLLNFCGIDSSLIKYVIDLNPNKQGKFLPGSRIPIFGTQMLSELTPDVLLVLPWNISTEIKSQQSHLSERGVRFLRAIPSLEYF